MNFSSENISHTFLILTAIISVVYYKKYQHTPLKYLPYYLWYAVILEMGAILLTDIFKMYNVWWYNIGINIEILFYLFLFYQFTDKQISKKIILYGGIIYEAYFLISYLIDNDWNMFQNFPFSFGGLLIIIVVLMFLIEMFQSDKILYFYKYLIFWISVGLLVYNIIPLPLFVVRVMIKADLYEFTGLMNIQYFANIFMYLSFIYGFIRSSKSYKTI